MLILALDLGTKCGWACSNGESGVWNLKPKSTESIGQRYVKFEQHLSIYGALYDCGADLIVYEEVHAHSAVDAAHVYGALQGILQLFCINNGIEYRGVGVGSIKKHATGKGNADKEAMVKAAVTKFKSVNILDSNHADALWLLDYAQTLHK